LVLTTRCIPSGLVFGDQARLFEFLGNSRRLINAVDCSRVALRRGLGVNLVGHGRSLAGSGKPVHRQGPLVREERALLPHTKACRREETEYPVKFFRLEPGAQPVEQIQMDPR